MGKDCETPRTGESFRVVPISIVVSAREDGLWLSSESWPRRYSRSGRLCHVTSSTLTGHGGRCHSVDSVGGSGPLCLAGAVRQSSACPRAWAKASFGTAITKSRDSGESGRRGAPSGNGPIANEKHGGNSGTKAVRENGVLRRFADTTRQSHSGSHSFGRQCGRTPTGTGSTSEDCGCRPKAICGTPFEDVVNQHAANSDARTRHRVHGRSGFRASADSSREERMGGSRSRASTGSSREKGIGNPRSGPRRGTGSRCQLTARTSEAVQRAT